MHKDEFKREVVEETISKLGPAAIKIYMDGSVFRGCREEGAGALINIIDNHNQEEHIVEAPAGSTTSLYQAEIVAISVALQKVVELQKRTLVVLLRFPTGQSRSVVSVRFVRKTAVSVGFDFDFLPVP